MLLPRLNSELFSLDPKVLRIGYVATFSSIYDYGQILNDTFVCLFERISVNLCLMFSDVGSIMHKED